MNFAQCLHIVLVIGKHTFSGEILLAVGGYVGGSFHGAIFPGGGETAMKRGWISQHYSKKDQKLNIYKKTFFFKQHQNLKQTEMILYMIQQCSPKVCTAMFCIFTALDSMNHAELLKIVLIF